MQEFDRKKPHRNLVSQANVYKFLHTTAPHLPEFHVAAHGALVGLGRKYKQFVVPANVGIVFFTMPGCVMIGPQHARDLDNIGRDISLATVHSIMQGNLSLDKTEHRYTTMYVPGDVVPDMTLNFREGEGIMGLGMTNGRRAPFSPWHSRTSLWHLVHTYGPGIYYVGSCRGDPRYDPPHKVPKNKMTKLKRIDLLARTRLLPTTKTPSPQFAQLAAANLPRNFGRSHMYDANRYPFPKLNAEIKRLRPKHHATTKNLWFFDKDSTPRQKGEAMKMLRETRPPNTRPPNTKPPSTKPSDLRRKYGFNTKNEQRAQRLYIYHMTKANSQNKVNEINRAFNNRASKPHV